MVELNIDKSQQTANRLKAMELAKGMTKEELQEMKINANMLYFFYFQGQTRTVRDKQGH